MLLVFSSYIFSGYTSLDAWCLRQKFNGSTKATLGDCQIWHAVFPLSYLRLLLRLILFHEVGVLRRRLLASILRTPGVKISALCCGTNIHLTERNRGRSPHGSG
jgi:hypothetical protein